MAEETQEELMERIKKMSPEELLAFQKSRCIFCQIVAGKVQSKKIYEDSLVVAILDINPGNPGHVLVMPKEHYSIMPQVPEAVLKHLFVVVKKLSQVALKTLGARGTNIMVQNGIAAGQKAQHFMVHMIPRKENDGLNLILEKKEMSDNDYNVIKGRIKKRVNELFGIKEEVKEAKEEKNPVEEKKAEMKKEADDAPTGERKKDISPKNEEIKNVNKQVDELNKEIKELEGKAVPKVKEDEDDEVDGKEEGVNLDDISRLLGA